MDNMAQKETEFSVGGDLYGTSVEELQQRVQILKSEIMRIEAELVKKQSDLSDAEKLFGKIS